VEDRGAIGYLLDRDLTNCLAPVALQQLNVGLLEMPTMVGDRGVAD
jgi:hypothetical protein